MAPQETDIENIRSFNRFYTNIIGVIDRYILDTHYSLTEARILYEIYHSNNLTARGIKELLQVDEGYLSRILDKLIAQGLIIRTQSPGDKRQYFLSLSEKGNQEFFGINRLSVQAVSKMIDGLVPAQIEKLTDMMKKIEEILSARS